MNLENEVSEDVKKASREVHYASHVYAAKHSRNSFNMYYLLRNAFIAGASYMKPIEHTQLPQQETDKPNEYGKEIENNKVSI